MLRYYICAEPQNIAALQKIRTLGGYSVGVPPLPIPNREVKPNSVDGTAFSGRVDRRRIFSNETSVVILGFFVGGRFGIYWNDRNWGSVRKVVSLNFP